MSAAPGEKDDDPLTRSLFGLPEEDAAEALRRVTAEREALALEQSRMEQRFQRKNAARAAFVREALASTPALRAALVRSGAIDRDEDLGELAEQLLSAPLSDPDPRDPDAQSLHEAMATLRDAYAARRGDHSGYLGELAARRQALEKRQRDLLRETDRLYERQRELEDIRKDKARHAARMRAEAAELGLESSDYDGTTDGEESTDDDGSSERSEIVLTPRPRAPGDGTPSAPPRHPELTDASTDPDTPRLTRQSGLTPRRSASRKLRKETKTEYKGLFQVAPKKKWYEPDSDTDSVESFHRPVSPFVFPERPAEMKNLKNREELVKRLVEELGGGGDKRRLTYVPAKAKDRLLKMKLAHMPVAARLKYLQSTESYTGETDLTTLRPKTPTNKVGGTVENMCRELAVEICDIVVNKVATQPTEWSLTESRREWRRQESLRVDAICRQVADSLVREICASESQGIVAEIEAQYASSGAFVAKAIAAAVISRLDGAAVNELSFWEPEPDETPEQKARRKKREKERRAREKKAAKKTGGFFGGKKKPAADDDEPKGWTKPKKGGGDDDDDDFEFDRALLDAEGMTAAVEVEWSTSSSDDEDETGAAYETRVDRHACQLMLGEMQRRRPRGLVFHHTQPIREASPPPGVGRGVEMAAFAPKKDAGPAGAGDSESSTASDTSDDESEYDTSDEERAEYKKKLEDRAKAAEADAVGRAHNPPRTGVANLGRLAEPPPPIHVHRVAAKAEARYWGNVRVTESFAGKSVLKTASAVTSVRAAPGRNLNLAAGTSRGDIVIWKFPGGDDYASDEDDENAGPNSPDKGKGKGGGGGWFGGGTKKGESNPAAKKPKSRRVPTEPVVIAKAKLNPHPDREPDPVGINGTGPIERTEGEETSTDPTALYTAVTALDWSADGSQIASAERGGMSRMWTLVSAAKAGEKDKKKKAKLRMGETLWLAPVNHVTSSYPPEAMPPPIVDPDVLAKQQKEAAAKAAAGGGKKDPKAPAKGSKEEMRKNMEEEEMRALDEQYKRKHSRETWSHDAITIAHFFPAFTLGGRQPYAMFTRPNGDIVRTSPTLRPNVVSADGATIGITEVGTGAREISMFRGANAYGGGNAFSRIGAAKKAGKGPLDEILTIQSSESESEEEDADKRKRRRQRLDPSEHWASVPGQANVAGIDRLLDAADNFKMGAGSHMGTTERARLLSPDVNPIAPGKKSVKEAKARARRGEEHPASDLYSQDIYRGHTAPVVFIDTLPDSASIVSVDADGNVCLWAAFQGGQGRSGFGWHSPLGQWRLPKEVTAQVPAGPRVQIHPGGARGATGTDGDPARDVTHTHAPFLASFSKKGRRAVEAPKDKEWITADREAAAAVNALTRHVPYVNKLKGEKAPGAPRLDPEAALDTIDENGFEGAGALAKKSGFVIKPGDHSDYFLSVYNKTSNALLSRHRQRFVTARAEATVVGAKIAHESGVADLVVVRRIGGICKAAFRAGGLEAAEHAEPYFTAHVYSLDDMQPTVPRMDLPNPFPAPPGRGWGDKPNRPKNMNGADADAYAEEVQKGWKDPAPYPFVLAGVTPSLGTEHLIVPVGAGNLGVFSLASGLMVHAFDLPGVGGDQIECMETLRNPNPTGEVSSAFVPSKGGAGAGASVRALLVVATAGHKGVRIYALDEGAAQVARVTDTRAEVARMIGPPGEKKKGKKGGKGGKGEGAAGAVREGVEAGGYSSGDDSSGDESDTEDSDTEDSESTSNSSSSSDSSSDSDGEDLTRRTTTMSLRDDSPTRRAPFDRVVTNNR